MMQTKTPTDSELKILRVLWADGAQTVRGVHQRLRDDRADTGYTTTLKVMQVMHQKGLLERDSSQRSHVYMARVAMKETQEGLVSRLAEKAFGGSAAQLVMRAISSSKTSKRELDEIRALLDAQDERGKA